MYPWDYKVAELPRYWCNFSIPFLDFFAWLGWATDLKTVSDDMIRKRVLRTGDGSHRYSDEELSAKTAKELLDTFNNNNNNEAEEHVDTLWGWGKFPLEPAKNNLMLIHDIPKSGDDDMDPEEVQDVLSSLKSPKFGA